MKKFLGLASAAGVASVAALLIAPTIASSQAGGAQRAHEQYLERCADCHDVTSGEDRTPPKAQLALSGPNVIIEALTRGIMRPMADGMTEDEIRNMAIYLTGKEPLPTLADAPEPNLCAAQTPIVPGDGDWNGWGVDEVNTRYQPNPGFDAADVGDLEVKWAFAYPGKKNGQATIIGDRLFFTTNAGRVYSLNRDTGCVYWRIELDAASRTSPIVAESAASPSGWAIYFADDSMQQHAADAMTGEIYWTTQIEEHPRGVMTAAAALHDGVLYIPTSSMEETVSRETAYVCCSFRGSITAVDAETGDVKWQTYAIPAEPRVHRTVGDKNLLGPAGAAIWNTPTIDEELGRVYFATGDGYTDVVTTRTDAVIALDMESGEVVWTQQVTENDQFLVGCGGANQPANCPENLGPDHDFGQSPILFDLPDGKRILVIGQKSGAAYGMDPDNNGAQVWSTQIGSGGPLGGIQWGSAIDPEGRYFVAVADTFATGRREDGSRIPANRGVFALDAATGNMIWEAPATAADCPEGLRCGTSPAHSAAVSAMPGVVFSGTLDSQFRAYDAATGEVLWTYITATPVDTVNGREQVAGGAIDATGATIGYGYVFQHTGYSGYGGGADGENVLLAFTVGGE